MNNSISILFSLVVLSSLAQWAQAQSCNYQENRRSTFRHYYPGTYYSAPYWPVPLYAMPQPPSDLQLQLEFLLAQQRLNLQQQAMQAEQAKQYYAHVLKHNQAKKAKADAALAARIEKRRSDQAARIGQLTNVATP